MSDETNQRRTGIFNVHREVSRELLTAAAPGVLEYIKREMRQQLAYELARATDDGRAYVVRFGGWQERDVLDVLWCVHRFGASYTVLLRDAAEAQPGEYVDRGAQP